MLAIIAVIIGYLLGSIATGVMLSKLLNLPDPRKTGSGSSGATNILRTMGKQQAILVLAGDILKGVIAVLIARMFGVEGFMLGLVAFAAVVGHIFPIFFDFKGGKGVATAIGGIFVLNFFVGILCLVIWAGMAYFLRYSSLASIAASIAAPILMFFLNMSYAFPVLLIALLIIYKHLDNIKRLKDGTESKLNF